MAVYLVGYDLKKPGQDYQDLFEAIKVVGSDWWHCLDSTWLVVSDSSAVNVRAALVPHIDANDRLLVATMGKGAAWTANSFPQNCQDWLQKYL
jgi:hypothetical protein